MIQLSALCFTEDIHSQKIQKYTEEMKKPEVGFGFMSQDEVGNLSLYKCASEYARILCKC